MKKITREQFWELYKPLPQELKDALYSEKNGNFTEEVADRYGISDKQFSMLVDVIGHVLIGILPPDEFKETLENDLKIDPETAKKISREINRYIFYPLKNLLEDLYNMEIVKPIKPAFSPAAKIVNENKSIPEIPSKEEIEELDKPEKLAGSDVYQEPIE